MRELTAYTAKQKRLAGVVCLMIALESICIVLTSVDNRDKSLYVLFYILSSFAGTATLLMFLLPSWQQYRKWLKWLLVAFMSFAILAFVVDTDDFGLATRLFIVFALLLSPSFHLLHGIIRKKSTEKLAGVFSVVKLAIFIASALTMIEEDPLAWGKTIISLLSTVGSIIIYFTWPVLTRPILEKEEKETIEE